jgi:hypothetical protein
MVEIHVSIVSDAAQISHNIKHVFKRMDIFGENILLSSSLPYFSINHQHWHTTN